MTSASQPRETSTLPEYSLWQLVRYMFLHYWGKGQAVDLARAVKKAVDTQKP